MTLFTANHKNNNEEVKDGDIKISTQKFARYIRGCVNNRRRSQKKIYRAFYGQAMIVCTDYAASSNDAVDILNEGFLKIFKQVIYCPPVYTNEISSFLGWLQKTMLHTASEHYARNERYPISGLGDDCTNLGQTKEYRGTA